MNANGDVVSRDKVIYKELSYELVGCFYDVFNELGPGHKEQVYQEALKIAFQEKKIPYTEKARLRITFRGRSVGIYEPDFIVDDKIIVEIKSVSMMPKVFEKQLYYYLRGTPYSLGYLVNFGSDKIEIRRRIYDAARTRIHTKDANPTRITCANSRE